MKIKSIIFLVFAIAFAGCENYDLDLYDQDPFKHQEYPRFDAPKGSVPINEARVNYEDVDAQLLVNPHSFEGLAEKGVNLFNIYCSPCHGLDGTTADTPVADKFDPRPADLTDEAVASLTEGEIFYTIVQGIGLMPPYRFDLSDEEAWQVTAYVLKLQDRE